MNIQEIADHLNVTVNRVRDLRQRGVFPKAAEHAQIEVYEEALKRHEANSRKSVVGRENDPNTTALSKHRAEKEAALARKANADAEKAEREAALARGETILVTDFIVAVQEIQRAVHEALVDFAPQLAANVGLTARQQKAVEEHVDRLRAEIRQTVENL